MSDDRMFDRNARTWLELGPTTAPRKAVEAALLAIETTPQQRSIRAPWRFAHLTIQTRFAVAAVVALMVVGAGLLIVRIPQNQIGQPSPSPTASPSPWIVFESDGSPESTTGSDDGAGQLWAVKSDGSGLHVIAGGMSARGGFDISPDGSMVAFSASSGLLWEAPIEGGDATQLSNNCSGYGEIGTCVELDPAYSPDGTRIAFVRFDTDTGSVIAFLDRATGAWHTNEPTRTTSIDGFSMHPAWSPDSTRIAFVHLEAGTQNKGKSHIAIVPVDVCCGQSGYEAALRALVDLPLPPGANLAALPEWSPDGSLILFSTSPADLGYAESGTGPWLHTVHPDGSGVTNICGDCAPRISASWTPNGRILFWNDHSWALMDADGANRVFINEEALTFAGAERTLSSAARIQPQPQIGNPSPTTVHSPSPTATAISDYKSLEGWIVFERDRRGIWLVKADGSGLHELAPGLPVGGKRSFDISPDGTRVVFEGPGTQIWEAPIDGGDPTLLSTDCGAGATGEAASCSEREPAYSPDGTKIAFVRYANLHGWDSVARRNQTNVMGIRDLATGEVTLLESTRSADVGQHVHWPTWSPDGSQIAFQRFSDLYVDANGLWATWIAIVNIDGTGLRDVTSPTSPGHAGRPDWSPDGSSILFSTAVDDYGDDALTPGGGIYTIRPDGTRLTSICVYPDCLNGGGLSPVWTPDGNHILFWSQRTWALMDPDGGNQALINEEALASTYTGIIEFALLQPTP